MRPPNLLLLITDQQRQTRHWPDDPAWRAELMPNDTELARTGISFENHFSNAAMCSPSRASVFTGRYPAEHGVELTLTAADLRPDPRNLPGVFATMGDIVRKREVPVGRLASRFARGALQLGPKSGGEPELPADLPNVATLLRAAGYHVAYKGKWHLTHPLGGGEPLLGGWGYRDAARLEADFGFAEWEPPDAGENAKASNFGGGNAGDGEGWDEVYTRQVERWLGRAELPEPFCLIVSLVNPHDVLGYPAQDKIGGFDRAEFRDLGVGLPATIDENLSTKPGVHALMRLGMTAYLGPLRSREAQLEYVNFYAYLHRLVDEKIGRMLAALGSADDPGSLRSRTVVLRTSDHGEMGLSHGALRQKAFNAYEETINVPLVISNPVLFGAPARTEALSSAVDLLPTMLSLAGAEVPGDLRGRDLGPVLADAAEPGREAGDRAEVDLSPVLEHADPSPSVRDSIHYTYDDHQAATALQNTAGQPNRVRAVRTAEAKYVIYFDPEGKASNEYELYDLERDPDEVDNLLGVRTAEPKGAAAEALRSRMAERLADSMVEHGTEPRSAAS